MFLAAYVGTDPAGLMSKACTEKKNSLSLQVQFLFWQMHLNLVVTSFIIISRALMAADRGIGGSSAVCHRIVQSAAPGPGWEVVGFAGSGCCLPHEGRFCFCQNDTFAAAKMGMPKWDGLAVERYQLLSDEFWLHFGFQISSQR